MDDKDWKKKENRIERRKKKSSGEKSVPNRNQNPYEIQGQDTQLLFPSSLEKAVQGE